MVIKSYVHDDYTYLSFGVKQQSEINRYGTQMLFNVELTSEEGKGTRMHICTYIQFLK